MTKSEIFKAAHKMTREIKKSTDNYSATFGLCLKAIYEGIETYEDKLNNVHCLTEKTFELELSWGSPNFNKYKNYIKECGGRWNPTTKTWTLKTNFVPSRIAHLIIN
jgi:hypothetical protein